jgi:parallel beta-helix repeat protein
MTKDFIRQLKSFGLLIVLMSGCSRSWYVNDASSSGDVFTKAIGNKEKGNGSVNKPFLTIKEAVLKASPGDAILIDSGDYAEQIEPNSFVAILLNKERLSVEGAGVEKTIIQLSTNPKGFQCGIRILAEKIKLQNLSVKGGNLGVFIYQTRQTTIKNVTAEGQLMHGFLLDQVQQSELSDCQAQRSGFRGFQLKDANSNKIYHNISKESVNAGFCLTLSSGNDLQQNLAQNNGTSGFFINGSSHSNLVANNQAISNKIGGFYLYGKSEKNQLNNNLSQGNAVGISINKSYANVVMSNQIYSNKGNGIVFKAGSHSNRILNNHLKNNKAPQIRIAKEDEKNNRIENNIIEN